jgi:hypothetical protein
MALRRAPLVLATLLASTTAFADDTKPDAKSDEHESDNSWLRFIARKHTLALLETGIIVLPNAPISPNTYGGDVPLVPVGKGDATIQLGIHIFYRPFRDWAFGANFLFDPKPTSDTEYGGLSGLERSHTRAYFFIGGEGRYIPLHWRSFEGFVGAQTGVVIVADRFTTNAGIAKPAIFGDREVSLSTEGFFLGAQLGFDWYISDRVVAGLVTRYNHWVLPEQPKCSPILDCTTLNGGVDSIDFGFTLGYRISL